MTGLFNGTAVFDAGEENETILYSTGDREIFMAKYDPEGSLEWAKSAGGGNIDSGFGVFPLPDGSALLTGRFESTATFGAGEEKETVLSSAGGYDFFIAKFNP